MNFHNNFNYGKMSWFLKISIEIITVTDNKSFQFNFHLSKKNSYNWARNIFFFKWALVFDLPDHVSKSFLTKCRQIIFDEMPSSQSKFRQLRARKLFELNFSSSFACSDLKCTNIIAWGHETYHVKDWWINY